MRPQLRRNVGLRIGLASLLILGSVALFAPAVGAAADRYADPAGAGTACSQPAPCSLQIATESASANDEVIVAPGTYVETDQIGPTALGLDIHGAPGATKPTIQTSAGNGVILQGTDQRIADLRIEHSNFGGALSIYNDAIAERMVVETTNGIAACSPYFGSVLRDSVCIAKGVGGAGVGVSITDAEMTGVLRNVTAVATANNGKAIEVNAGLVLDPSANVTLNVRNTIAIGPPAGADIVLSATGGATANIDLQHSNYDTVDSTGASTFDPVGSPTNQTAAPQLTSAYRQLATSPTRNAGSADSLSGSLDADGASRVQGTAIDIGAYESDGVPPDTTLTSAPAARTRDATPGFTWSDTEPASESADCTMDGAAVSCTAGAYTSPLLADGPHTFSGRRRRRFLQPGPDAGERLVHGRHDQAADDDRQGPEEEDEVEEGEVCVQLRRAGLHVPVQARQGLRLALHLGAEGEAPEEGQAHLHGRRDRRHRQRRRDGGDLQVEGQAEAPLTGAGGAEDSPG